MRLVMLPLVTFRFLALDDICVTFTGTDDNSQEPLENGFGNDGTFNF
jgi:hypothetical protein